MAGGGGGEVKEVVEVVEVREVEKVKNVWEAAIQTFVVDSSGPACVSYRISHFAVRFPLSNVCFWLHPE